MINLRCVDHESGFTQIDNKVIRSESLSADAKAMHMILMSYSQDYELKFATVARFFSSEYKARKAFKELQGAKLAYSFRLPKQGKAWGRCVILVSNFPQENWTSLAREAL